MEVTTAPVPATTRAAAVPSRSCAVLTASCDGYPAGTTGEVLGAREGCVVFVPDSHVGLARWAVARRNLLVPPALLVVLD